MSRRQGAGGQPTPEWLIVAKVQATIMAHNAKLEDREMADYFYNLAVHRTDHLLGLSYPAVDDPDGMDKLHAMQLERARRLREPGRLDEMCKALATMRELLHGACDDVMRELHEQVEEDDEGEQLK